MIEAIIPLTRIAMTTALDHPDSPTLALYGALQRAFDHFDAELFERSLPPCLISLRSSSRVYGYHHAGRFVAPDGTQVDELGLHPGFFTLRAIEEVLSTLVHEMVHHWQRHHGTPTPSTAHNREWAAKMASLGLPASNTGLPGGKETGRAMSHYIRPDGAFLASCRRLLDTGFQLPWLDRHVPAPVEYAEQRQAALKEAGIELPLSPPPVTALPPAADGSVPLVPPPPKREKDRVRFACLHCETKAWARPDTELLCGICSGRMEAS